ncbi:MAG: ComEC family competence protein [Flavobacteriaceae bacterium]
MKKLLEYLPFHFTLSLIIGITSQFNFRIWSFGFSRIVYTILILFLLLLLLRKTKYYFLSVWIFFFYIGVVAVFIQNDTNYPSYYEKHYRKKSTAILAIEKVLKPGNFYHKYEATIIQVDDHRTKGKVLLNIQRDSLLVSLRVGSILLLKPEISELFSPLNPHQFDYKDYLKKQGIHHQIFLKKHEFVLKEVQKQSLKAFAFNIRSKVQSSLQKYPFKKDELVIINALLLGQRQEISKELVENYSKAGAIHILAVSGLHIGIILLILSYLFKPLESIKNGVLFKAIIIIFFLWAFALIAGLSASVVRAVTMFTFVAIGSCFKMKNSVMYSLIGSIFVLLLIKPLFLFNVGFQLSYLAVFGIVWIQPKLYKIWKPRYKIADKFWQLSTVSIAAQLGILPLSLYYFHQFPGLFIASNLVIIPFLGAILMGGILVSILAVIGVLPNFLATLYGYVISLMNDFIRFISEQEKFLFTEISFSSILMIASYIVALSMGFLFSKWNYRRSVVFLVSVIILQGVLLFEKHTIQQKESLIIFHKSRNTIVGLRKGDSLKIYHDLRQHNVRNLDLIKFYRIGEMVSFLYEDTLPNFFQVDKKTILIINKEGIYNFEGYKNSIIVLRESPNINLERLIHNLEPRLIVVDGSNYKNRVIQWEQTCMKNKTPFWYTGQNGAYIVKK